MVPPQSSNQLLDKVQAWIGSLPKKWKVIGGVGALIVIVIFISLVSTITSSGVPEGPAEEIDLRRMLNLYEMNEADANQRYKGALVRMKGEVNDISGSKIEIIPYGSDMFQLSGAECSVTSSDKSKISGLVQRNLGQGRMGSSITIRGVHNGFSGFAYTKAKIGNCQINPGPESAPSPESDQRRDSGSLRTVKEVVNNTATPGPSRDSGSLRTVKEVVNNTATPGPTNTSNPTPTLNPTPTPTPTPSPTPTRMEQATSALDSYNKGEVFRISGDCEAAIPEYDRAIEIDFINMQYEPRDLASSGSFVNRNAYFFKAYCQGEIGQYAIAEITYGKIETETHNSIKYALTGPEAISPALVYFNIAVVLYKNGDHLGGQVSDYYTTAMRIDQSLNAGVGGCQYMCGMTDALKPVYLDAQMTPNAN